MRRLLRLLLLALCFTAARADEAQEKTFEEIWSKVRDRYFDETFGGADWNKIHEDYLPRVRQARDEAEFYRLMDRMLAETGHSHLVLLHPHPSAVPPRFPQAGDGPPAGPGLDLRFLDGVCRVVSVIPEGAAWKAGLRTGDALEEIDATPVARIVEGGEEAQDLPGDEARKRFQVMGELVGPGNRPLKLAVRSAQGELRRIEVTRDQPLRFSPPIGNLPALPVELEARRLKSGVGYIRFNLFLMGEMDGIRKAVQGMKNAPGIILDLRGNPGGMGVMAQAVARLFLDCDAGLGEMHLRGRDVLRFPVSANPRAYLGPLVLLLDGTSASTSEILAMGLQECGRAVVAGSRSAGAALPSVIEHLDCGLMLQFPIADFHTPKGATLEGKGVTPDLEAPWALDTLREGKDPGVEKAVDAILSGKVKPWPPQAPPKGDFP